MGALIQHIRYGCRTLRKNPGFTFVAVVSLALGIGANTAIFSLINAVFLRPLPLADPDSLVMLWEDASEKGFPRNDVSPANFLDFKAQNRTLEDLAAIDRRGYNLTGDGEPEQIYAFGVTSNFFSLLGVQPVLGRVFAPEEDRPGNEKVVMLSYALWRSRYGGERNVIGRELSFNDEKYTVVGVLPAAFRFLDNGVDVLVPIAFTPQLLQNRGRHYLVVFGRMKGGVTLDDTRADLLSVSHRIEQDVPGVNGTGKVGAVVLSLREQLAGSMRRPLAVLMVAVGFVLLIACANVANLLLARSTKRRREIAIRTALGANRARTIAQSLTESMLLAVGGAMLGLIFAEWGFAFLQRMIPDGIVISDDLNLDGRILGFTLVVALLTGLIFGLAPALHTARVNLNELLKQSGGRTSLQSGARFRSALVIAEVALSMMLLVSSGLLIRTFFNLHGQYGALRAESLLTLGTPLSDRKYGELPRRVEFYDQVLSRVKSLPGVVNVGYATTLPLRMKGGTNNYTPEGRQFDAVLAATSANVRQVSGDYFDTIGIALKQGRRFNPSDNAQSILVVIVNETMARQAFPNIDPIGKRFKIGGPDSKAPWATIIGVVADVRQAGMDDPVRAEMYFSYRQGESGYAPRDLVIRTAVAPSSLVAAVRREIHAVDANLPITDVETLDEFLSEETAERALGMTLLTAFSLLALLLSALGIYGVLSYSVAQSIPEIGVQMALGAESANVLAGVVKKGMLLAVAGVAIGWIAALGLTRFMQSLLFEVSAADTLTFAAVAVLLIAVAFLASYLPARRAMKVDPMIALRYE